MSYAARVVDGVVTQVIVGDPVWAADRLGGVWVGSDVRVGAGWVKFDGGLRPPPPFSSWVWDAAGWVPPVPQPDGDWVWDEDGQVWVEAEVML